MNEYVHVYQTRSSSIEKKTQRKKKLLKISECRLHKKEN